MKSVIKVFCLLAVTVLLCGFAYKQYVNFTTPVETRLFMEIVHHGDTFNAVISQYHDGEVNECWDEWQTRQKQINHKLFENGRALQAGDVIYIVTNVRVQK